MKATLSEKIITFDWITALSYDGTPETWGWFLLVFQIISIWHNGGIELLHSKHDD